MDEAKKEYESSDQFRGFIPRRKKRAEGSPSTLLPPGKTPTWAVADISSPTGKFHACKTHEYLVIHACSQHAVVCVITYIQDVSHIAMLLLYDSPADDSSYDDTSYTNI